MSSLLHEHDSELEQQLLRAGKDVELSAASKAQLLAALGVAAGVTAAGEAVAAPGLLSKLWASKALVAGASAVSVGALGMGVYLTGAPAEDPPAQVTGTTMHAAAPAPRAPEALPGPKASPPDEVPATSETQASSAPEPEKPVAARTPGKKSSEGGDSLGQELALVEGASRAVKAGNGSLALQRLSEYRRRFPRGKLGLEAQVLHIEALALSGRRAEASRLAQGFLKRHPQSPVVARIRRFAEGSP